MTKSAGIGSLLGVASRIMEGAVYASFITNDESGQPNARAVRPFPPDDEFARIVVASHRDTRKAQDVERDGKAVLSYVDVANRGYVTIMGKAVSNTDPEQKRAFWADRAESLSAFWPAGPDSDGYLLIEVTPERLEFRSYLLGVAEEPTRWTPVALKRGSAGRWQQTG